MKTKLQVSLYLFDVLIFNLFLILSHVIFITFKTHVTIFSKTKNLLSIISLRGKKHKNEWKNDFNFILVEYQLTVGCGNILTYGMSNTKFLKSVISQVKPFISGNPGNHVFICHVNTLFLLNIMNCL